MVVNDDNSLIRTVLQSNIKVKYQKNVNTFLRGVFVISNYFCKEGMNLAFQYYMLTYSNKYDIFFVINSCHT